MDFTAQASLNKPLVLERMRGDYLDRRENILLVGNSGTAKTNLATALGMAACGQGKRVRFYRITEVIKVLIEAREERQLLRLRTQLGKQEFADSGRVGVCASEQGRLGVVVRYHQHSL